MAFQEQVSVAAVPAAADDHRRDRASLVIGDVENAGRGRDNRALNSEWVEVKNTGRHGVQLRGFTLTDKQGNRYRFNDFRLEG
ncbi:lamin tail domain-containing protein, partial [Streptomyces sp. NPDC054865]